MKLKNIGKYLDRNIEVIIIEKISDLIELELKNSVSLLYLSENPALRENINDVYTFQIKNWVSELQQL